MIFFLAVCTNPCLYGGTCAEPDRCECVMPYGGDDCSQGVRNMYNFTYYFLV